MKRKNIVILAMAALLLLCGGCGGRSYFEQTDLDGQDAQERQEQEAKEADGETEPTDSAEICVQVCGAVVSPGVYRLAQGSRIYEALEMAGGLREDACDRQINQASPLEDGQQIYVPTQEEAAEVSAGSGVQDDGRININTATEAELMSLTGIGEGKAKAIVAYRQEHGAFASEKDITKVSGIGESTYQKIADAISVH